MEITTTCRRYEVEPGIMEHAEKRINKLERYVDSIQEAHLVLAQEKYRYRAELTIHADGVDVTSRENSKDMGTSIDSVCARVERQLKKHAARLKKRNTARIVPMGSVLDERDLPEVEVEEEYAPVVVRSAEVAPSAMSVEQAIEFLREKDWDLMMFENSRSGRNAVIYHRPDGNYGLVETP